MREFLAAEFSLTAGFSIYVDKQQLSPADVAEEERTIKELIPDLGTVTGRIKIATRIKDVVKPGLIIYVRGRAIEGPTLYDINTPSHHYRVASRIVGEVNADFLDPDEPKDLLTRTSSRPAGIVSTGAIRNTSNSRIGRSNG